MKMVKPARWLAVAALLAVVWMFGSQLLVPPLIESAYQGQSHPLLNRIITGQERHDVDHYLSYWGYLRRIGMLLILAAGSALYLVGTRRRGDRLPLLDPWVDHDTLSVQQSVRFGVMVLVLATASGLLSSWVSTRLGYRDFIDAMVQERGVAQLGTFGFLAVGTLLAWLVAWLYRALRVDYLLISFLMTAYVCRELDFPIMLRIGRPEAKWRPFLESSASLPSKAVFVLLILMILLAIVLLIYRKSIFRALARREAWAIYGLVWGVMLVSSQVIDKSPVGFELRYSTFEEPFELFASAVCLLSICSLAWRDVPQRSSKADA